MPMVDARKQAVLDGAYLADAAFTAGANVWVGLSTTTPTEAGANVTEPSGNAYARVSTAAATWNASSGTGPTTKSNGSAIVFTQATGSWGTVTYVTLHDAATAGNLVGFGALTASTAVNNGDTVQFAIGALVLKLGKPTDTY
jgi:hypothetical protein